MSKNKHATVHAELHKLRFYTRTLPANGLGTMHVHGYTNQPEALGSLSYDSQKTPVKEATALGCSTFSFKRAILNPQEYLDFLRFSRCCRSKGVEVFEETGPRKTDGAKVPFDNVDAENYLSDVGLRGAAARFAGPITGVQSVEDALSCDFDPWLRRQQGRATCFPRIVLRSSRFV